MSNVYFIGFSFLLHNSYLWWKYFEIFTFSQYRCVYWRFNLLESILIDDLIKILIMFIEGLNSLRTYHCILGSFIFVRVLYLEWVLEVFDEFVLVEFPSLVLDVFQGIRPTFLECRVYDLIFGVFEMEASPRLSFGGLVLAHGADSILVTF